MTRFFLPNPFTRRRFTLSALAATVAACSQAPVPGRSSAGTASTASDLQPVENAGFAAWKRGARARAAAAGIPEATLAQAFDPAGYLPGVIAREGSQFHTRRTIEDYIAIAASDDNIATGKAMLRRHAGQFDAIEARYGVAPEVVAAVWGHETKYGARRGDVPVVPALATLAYGSRRAGFFEGQMMAALKILARGEVPPARFLGSWAGALGHTQFIPTTYLAYAVDFDGDGRRDLLSDDPADALASAAAYLQRSGWRRNGLWGIEVRPPEGTSLSGRRSIEAWRVAGVRAASGGPVPDHGTAELVRPAGASGPAFLLFANAAALRRYNNTLHYVLGVGHLSDRLAGGGPLIGRFAPDAEGLTLAGRKEIQRLLAAKGFDPGGSDGVIGPKTVAAIEAYEAARGLPVTGKATKALLAHLRG